jgi:acetyl-CoA carboxylase carboxyl transferase subunit alpha
MLMLQYSIYSVISPEGCASILWKRADKAEAAAEAMGVTAVRLHELGLIDEIVTEPLGGAHRNPEAMAEALQNAVLNAFAELEAHSLETLLEQRRRKLAGYGAYKEA